MIKTNERFPLCIYPSHVLFQFILTGYLRAREASGKLESLISHPNLCTTTLIPALENLIGTTSSFHENFAWNIKCGVLTTLKNNCTFFQLSLPSQSIEAYTIKKLASKAWIYATELMELAHHFSASAESNEHLYFLKTAKKLITSLKSLGIALTKMIAYFGNNENILYYLINHKTQLDNTYGPNYTAKMIRKIYKKLNFATDFLVEAYQKRGFEKLIPHILQKMNALQ